MLQHVKKAKYGSLKMTPANNGEKIRNTEKSNVCCFFKRKAVNGEYCANLLQRLREEIKQNRPHLSKKTLFHQDNVHAHKSVIVMAKINELKFELLPHAPYAQDLAPSEYFLFLNLKKWLSGQRFSIEEEVYVGS
ncbi:mariner transposase [Trichonephila clavipes]|nr:mariner transposase [Trichonephila clavipes]